MATTAIPGGKVKVRAGNAYFYWSSVLMLAFVLIGFAPTFFLRAFFDVEPIPFYLYLHGGVLTAWYAWLVVQTWLIRSGRTVIHRKTGWWGAGIGAAVIFAGPMATFGSVARARALLDWNDDMSAIPMLGIEGVRMIEFFALIFWGNLLSIAAFALLVGWAILWRQRAEWHKRLLILASFGLIAPPLARISRLPGFGGEGGLFVPLVMLALLLSLVAHDLYAKRRVHKATLVGIGVLVIATVVRQIVASSQWGQETVMQFG